MNTVPYAALVAVGRYVALAVVTAGVVAVQIVLALAAGALDSVWLLAAGGPDQHRRDGRHDAVHRLARLRRAGGPAARSRSWCGSCSRARVAFGAPYALARRRRRRRRPAGSRSPPASLLFALLVTRLPAEREIARTARRRAAAAPACAPRRIDEPPRGGRLPVPARGRPPREGPVPDPRRPAPAGLRGRAALPRRPTATWTGRCPCARRVRRASSSPSSTGGRGLDGRDRVLVPALPATAGGRARRRAHRRGQGRHDRADRRAGAPAGDAHPRAASISRRSAGRAVSLAHWLARIGPLAGRDARELHAVLRLADATVVETQAARDAVGTALGPCRRRPPRGAAARGRQPGRRRLHARRCPGEREQLVVAVGRWDLAAKDAPLLAKALDRFLAERPDHRAVRRRPRRRGPLRRRGGARRARCRRTSSRCCSAARASW